jgi:hypothetical protein
MKRNLTQAETNHLRRLLGWVRCEIGQTPDEIVQTVAGLADKGAIMAEGLDDAAKARLVEHHQRAAAVPRHVRAAVKALERLLQRQEGAIVDVGAGVGLGPIARALLPPSVVFGVDRGAGDDMATRFVVQPFALSTPAPWMDEAPSVPGRYRFTCDEHLGQEELIVVERRGGHLVALGANVGTIGVAALHAGLTNPRWQKMEDDA